MKLSDVLYSRIYRVPCAFANVERFVEQLSWRLDLSLDFEVESKDCHSRVNRILSDLRRLKCIENESTAEEHLLADDLENLFFVEGAWQWPGDEVETVEERLHNCRPVVSNRLEHVGLRVADVPLQIVDRFPEPFDQFDWSAFAPDRDDQTCFGISPGIYFRRDRLRPFYSEALYAHEIIHTITGVTDPEVYAMGLEEGIAEVLGSCYAASGILPTDVLRNILILGRHGCDRPTLWTIYLDHTRQAYLLFREYGLEGLAEILRRGRKYIHSVEKQLILGKVTGLDLPKGVFDPATRDLLEFHCCSFLPSYVFSPLEYLLIRHVERGRRFEEICERAGVVRPVGHDVLRKLSARSALYVQSGGEIVLSNVEKYRSVERKGGPKVLRYLPALPKANRD